MKCGRKERANGKDAGQPKRDGNAFRSIIHPGLKVLPETFFSHGLRGDAVLDESHAPTY
jgi:hypothetical protein